MLNPRIKVFSDVVVLDAQLRKLAGSLQVFTNGVFDVLHPGHVDVLEFARSCGDLLVVGVNDDQSVRRLAKKGERPVFPLAERMEMLSALSCVDYVIPFTQDTPLELIRALSTVMVLVKGGDYRMEEMVGREIMAERGGDVRLFGLTKGYSTTSILNKVWAHQG